MPASRYDRVLAVATDGLVPATWLSLCFDIPLSIVSISPMFEFKPPHLLHERCLFVDTILKSGFTLMQAIAAARSRGTFCNPTIAGALVVALDTRYTSREAVAGLIPRASPDAPFADVHYLALLSSGIDEEASQVYLRCEDDVTGRVHRGALSRALRDLKEKMGEASGGDESALATEVERCCRVPHYQYGDAMDFREIFNYPSLLRWLACHWYEKWFRGSDGSQAPAIVCGSRYGLPLAVAVALKSMLASESPPEHVPVYRASLASQKIHGLDRLKESGRRVVIVDSTLRSGLAAFNVWRQLKDLKIDVERVLVLGDQSGLHDEAKLAEAVGTDDVGRFREFRAECRGFVEPIYDWGSAPTQRHRKK